MFSTHYFQFCTEVITKIYKHYPNLSTEFHVFKCITDLFLFLHSFPPDYTETIPSIRQIDIPNDCWLYLIHSYQTFTHFIPQLDLTSLGTPIDYGFHSDYQNSITHIILTLLNRCKPLIDKSKPLITYKEAEFIQDILCPRLNKTDKPHLDTTIRSLCTKLNDLFITHNIYVLPDALQLLSNCWLYMINQPLSLRISLFYYITTENENR